MRDPADPIEIVRRGYDAVSWRYRADNDRPEAYRPWTEDLSARLATGASVLDLGCGCGVPVARDLDAVGFAVTGVDVSGVQVRRARELVPNGRFVHADARDVDLPAAAFDAVVCLYAIIHVPLESQPALIERMATWLRPNGWLLLVAGQREWTGTEREWLGGDAEMWWSQADAATYRRWLDDAGFTVVTQAVVPEGAHGHSLFLAQRR